MRDGRLDTLAASVISETLHSLPTTVREAAKACVIEPVFMSDCIACREEIEDDLLGLFEGCSLLDGEPGTPDQLPRIRLFLDNLWDYTEGNTETFKDEVRVTLLHELGHYLGYDEEQVEERGLG
ncbi:putative Zn-dependent protease with MMP-like domain [Prosthecobacter fusiformis]|uniref:Putative Zn-dependent protease with MMP-like domain n=1 Tax=Prosthecobacter fusiformis TaxID=48464 RepID=A0A4R7SS52_9BACT|nr:metallopeptidase family protein [Prosthecobacter fusiformis]TDU81017.1 putative Zn-dependent protease with MMP-like domain [Prosthecobacter fusiformis]